jgi:hypothetical protein
VDQAEGDEEAVDAEEGEEAEGFGLAELPEDEEETEREEAGGDEAHAEDGFSLLTGIDDAAGVAEGEQRGDGLAAVIVEFALEGGFFVAGGAAVGFGVGEGFEDEAGDVGDAGDGVTFGSDGDVTGGVVEKRGDLRGG